MTAFVWDLIGSSWEIVVAGLLLLVFLGVVAGPEEDEEKGTDPGAEWDRARDQWIDEQNGVA